MGHQRSPVAALSDVGVISKPQHQFIPHRGDPLDTATGCGWLAGEAEAGEAGYDKVKGVRGSPPIFGGVSQRLNNIEKLQH